MAFWIALAGNLFEAAGVLVLLIGTLWAFGDTFRRWRAKEPGVIRSLRRELGKALLLGLELLVAADIVRTISTHPSLEQVLALGLIVLIRTFLSFSLSMEIEGRWPWQRSREPES